MTARPPIIVLGAGGLGRESVGLLRAVNAEEPMWNIAAFLDDDPDLHGRTIDGVPVVGPLELVAERSECAVVLCLGNPYDNGVKARTVTRLGLEKSRCPTVVHPSAQLGPNVSVEAGSLVFPLVVMTADVTVGNFVVLMPGVILTHDDRIADYATFGAGSRIGGRVIVEQGAYVGAGATVREGVVVGRDAVVGLGAVVTKDVPAGEVWAGVPARQLRRSSGPLGHGPAEV